MDVCGWRIRRGTEWVLSLPLVARQSTADHALASSQANA